MQKRLRGRISRQSQATLEALSGGRGRSCRPVGKQHKDAAPATLLEASAIWTMNFRTRSRRARLLGRHCRGAVYSARSKSALRGLQHVSWTPHQMLGRLPNHSYVLRRLNGRTYRPSSVTNTWNEVSRQTGSNIGSEVFRRW